MVQCEKLKGAGQVVEKKRMIRGSEIGERQGQEASDREVECSSRREREDEQEEEGEEKEGFSFVLRRTNERCSCKLGRG